MNKTIISTLLLIMTTLGALAQEKKDSIYLYGSVADSFTKASVPDVLLTLMKTDSTMVDSARVYKSSGYTWGIGRGAETTHYYFKVSREPMRYILRFEHPDYETTFADFEMKKVSRRQDGVEGPKVYMRKLRNSSHHEGGSLDEVVVRATKVKMVWKGDTLVFNADAFNVPEGSMLDGLIKQLPGVELNENGEIFVKGKKIDNLTLNGADFFKGKNKIMLENLPYFTVKSIEVYNKQTEENKMLGITDEDKKEYTMDVVLKREYNKGGSANLEAGYGTDNRYKFKGFGMAYSDHTRAVLFGGANNINQTADYDSNNQEYKDRTHQAGDRHYRQVGGMFTYLGAENKVNNATEVNVVWKDDTGDTRQSSESYLTDGSTTYGQSASHNRSRPVNVGVRNTFRLTGPIGIFSRLNLDYNKHRYDSEGWDVSTADAMMTDSINSSRYSSRSRADYLSGYGTFSLSKRMKTEDSFLFALKGDFSKQMNPETESENYYIYHRLNTTDERNRLTQTPSYSYNYSATLHYRYVLKDWNISPSYGIGQRRSHNERSEFLRDATGLMPDYDNSNESSNRILAHNASVLFSYSHSFKDKGYVSASADFRLNFERQHMGFDMPGVSSYTAQQLTRHYTRFEPYFYLYYSGNDRRKRLSAYYSMSHNTPSAGDLLDRPQTSDPLNIYLSNRDLNMETTHSLDVDYMVRRDSIDQTLRFEWIGRTTHNAISRGYSYDPVTGVRTYRPENISGGNWYTTFYVAWDRAVDKRKYWNIGNEWRVTYTRSTALANVTDDTDRELSRVGNVLLSYKPSVRFQKDNLTVRLKGEVAYRNIHRNITLGEQPTDLWDFSYGLYAQYKLPWQLTIDTDLSMNSHRGYNDPEMNDNRLYWDASLTKSIKAGTWVIKLRGYDLLGQVSNLRYSINAQGRTETWSNTLRRYALLTVSYRFAKKPKK